MKELIILIVVLFTIGTGTGLAVASGPDQQAEPTAVAQNSLRPTVVIQTDVLTPPQELPNLGEVGKENKTAIPTVIVGILGGASVAALGLKIRRKNHF